LKLARWLVIGVAAVGIVTLLVDFYFRSVVSAVARDSDRSVVIARDGILLSRRAVQLTCSPAGVARILTKVRLEVRDYFRPGAQSNGIFQLAEWERRAKADVQAEMPITITAMGLFDTLESDPLDAETLERIAGGLGDPKLDFVAVHGFDHGVYFERSGPADLRPVERCLPRVRSALAR
jgi:hypothetical protein